MNILYVAALLVGGELLIHFVFFLISRLIGKANKDRINFSSILKGVLERIYVVTTLLFNLTSAITLLGALKIATRIKDTEDRVSNDFFLIGNLLSVLFGIGYYLSIKYFVS